MKKRRTHHHRWHDRSRIKVLLLAALVLLLFAGLLFGIKLVGSRWEDTGQPESTGSLEGRFTDNSIQMSALGRDWGYRTRELTNILFIGVDWEDTSITNSGRYRGQADFLLLAALDRKQKTIRLLPIDRDTMTDVRIYGPFGDYSGKRTTQICLSYAYGADSRTSCECTAWAVSQYLGGIPIDACVALDMSSIALLNDAVGGVTVTLEEDLSRLDPQMVQGATMTLQGEQAETYVRSRMGVGDGTNASRMRRQRQYMEALWAMLQKELSKKPEVGIGYIEALGSHVYSTAQQDWLADQLYGSSGYALGETLRIDGAHIIGNDGFMEFWPETEALTQLITQTWFQ